MLITFSQEELENIIKEHLKKKTGKEVFMSHPIFQQYETYGGYITISGDIRFQAEVDFE